LAEFLRDLRGRGLHGVQLVDSDAHTGLTAAIATVLQGATWQGRVDFLRNVLAKVPKTEAEMVAAYIRTVFAQPTPAAVRDQLDLVADTLAPKLPAVAAMLREAKADLTAFADFPHAHWAKIWSTNPNGSTRSSSGALTSWTSSRTPTPCCDCRHALLIEAHDEWLDADRRYLSEGSMGLLYPTPPIALPTRPRR
jgi:putative transposase